MFIERTKRINAEIDMTPLIDVVFQLLIFLMVSSQFTKPERKIDLPMGASAAETIKKPETKHTLTITADNNIFLGETSIPTKSITEKLTQLIAESKITHLEIRGDQASELGLFIEVIEAAKASDIKNLSYHKKSTPTSNSP